MKNSYYSLLYLLQRVSLWKKWHVIYAFFFVRKIIAHWVTFFFYCIIIPATILVPEVHLPRPLAIYLPACITILNAASILRYEDPAKQTEIFLLPNSCNSHDGNDCWEFALTLSQVYASARILDTV